MLCLSHGEERGSERLTNLHYPDSGLSDSYLFCYIGMCQTSHANANGKQMLWTKFEIWPWLEYQTEKAMATHSSTLAWKIPWTEEPGRLQFMGSLSPTRLSDFTFTFHFHALEEEMATHSSVLAWRIPGMAEPGGLPPMGSQRVRHDWSDLATAAEYQKKKKKKKKPQSCSQKGRFPHK